MQTNLTLRKESIQRSSNVSESSFRLMGGPQKVQGQRDPRDQSPSASTTTITFTVLW